MSDAQDRPIEPEGQEGSKAHDHTEQAPEEAATGGPTPVGRISDASAEADAAPEPAPESAGAGEPAHAAAEADPTGATAMELPELGERGEGGEAGGIDLLSDVNVNVRIELGRTEMLVEDVLRLGEGAVVELDKLAGDPVDIFVNDRPVARGEVLVLNDNFCVRVNEILAPAAKAMAPGDVATPVQEKKSA